MRIINFEERAVGSGANAKAMAIVEIATDQSTGTFFGVGHHSNIVTASLMAIISGTRRSQTQLYANVGKRRHPKVNT